MNRSIGTTIVLGLLVCGVGLGASKGNLNASEPIVTVDGVAYSTVTKNVEHLVAGEEYKGVLEISHLGIGYVSEYAEWLEVTPWNRVLGWKCFGSKQRELDEEDLCTLWVQVQEDSSISGTHLFFKVPCEMVASKKNWEVLEAFDPRGRF